MSGTSSVTNSTVILIISSLRHTAMSLRVRLCPETPELSHDMSALGHWRTKAQGSSVKLECALKAKSGHLIALELIDRPTEKPLGAGEAACTAVGAALANAVSDATGVRLRTVPFMPDRVKAALKGIKNGGFGLSADS